MHLVFPQIRYILYYIYHNRPVMAELALLFGGAFGQSPQYWLNLQAAFDLKRAEAALGKQLLAIAELGEGYFTGQSGEYGGFAGIPMFAM
jgi:hypothetical protein